MGNQSPHLDKPFVLVHPESESVVVSASSVVDGVPRQRFRKDVIRVGEFAKASDGIRFEVTPDTLNHWAATFSQMKADGVRVPLLSDHIEDADHARGTVEDMVVDGDRLYAIVEAVGEDAIAAAQRNDVSIFSPGKQEAGNGKTYARPIQHVALTPRPIINNLGPAVAIAASNGASEQVDVLKPKKEKPAMDFTKISKALGIEQDITEDNAEALILSAAETLSGKVTEAEQKATDAATKIAGLEGKVSDKPLVLSNTERVLSVRGLESDLRELVSGGKITPAVAEKIKPHLSTDLMLSVADGKSHPNYAPVLEALKDNDPVKLGEQSQQQALKLSDPNKSDANADPLNKFMDAKYGQNQTA